MKFISITRVVSGFLLAATLAACGGGGGDAAPPPPVAAVPPVVTPPVPTQPDLAQPNLAYPIPGSLWSAPVANLPTSGNYIYLQSTSGDYIGQGRTYLYTQANAAMTFSSDTLGVEARVAANENWNGSFRLPKAAGALQSGYFKDLTRAAFSDPAVGGLDWSGDGRGCNTMKGWVVIDNIVQTGGMLSALDMRFEQSCEGGGPPLRGQVHWTHANADNPTPPQPAPIPAGLWKVMPSPAMAAGNYFYLEGGFGNFVTGGRTYSYDQTNAAFRIRADGSHLIVGIAGNENWNGDFQGMGGMPQLTVGYYANLKRFPFHNPVLGGMDWGGESRGCNRLDGWFAVDSVSYSGSTLTAIDLRFEQLCENEAAPLRGQLHWRADDPTTAPGPQAVPAGLWSPGASFVPPAGNYVYLVSEPGDYVGGGFTQLLTQDATPFLVDRSLTAALRIGVGGHEGNFVGMSSLSQLQPGYYGNLQGYPFHNALRGGLSWNTPGRACNTVEGWFVVDRVSYSMGQLTAIDLRFEQYCGRDAAALHGVIHWAR